MGMKKVLVRFAVMMLPFLACAWPTADAQTIPARPAQRQLNLAKPAWVDTNIEAPNGTKYVTFASKTLGGDVSYLIYLPPDYEKETRRYPVIYWLHGLGGNQRGGTTVFVPRVDAAIRAGSLPPAIVVSVNGMVNSFYNDWQEDKRPVESVIIKDLIPHVDATYRTQASREGRLIQGYSMGGYGAGHLGFKYPELFGAVVIDAGALLAEVALTGPNMEPIFKGAWGGDVEKFWSQHPNRLVEKNLDQIKGKTQIRIGCGTADYLIARNRELHELLEKLSVEHEYVLVPDVGHNSGEYYKQIGKEEFAVHRRAFTKFEAK
jgi:endo-1,4-beta-xylanase